MFSSFCFYVLLQILFVLILILKSLYCYQFVLNYQNCLFLQIFLVLIICGLSKRYLFIDYRDIQTLDIYVWLIFRGPIFAFSLRIAVLFSKILSVEQFNKPAIHVKVMTCTVTQRNTYRAQLMTINCHNSFKKFLGHYRGRENDNDWQFAQKNREVAVTVKQKQVKKNVVRFQDGLRTNVMYLPSTFFLYSGKLQQYYFSEQPVFMPNR
eukprot:TRINITY_DN2741_c0_g1_i8.p1 TRINITY_DN2741_c0_g1~~TRINITY_DN2741_c0_g1_i8.p1  ORF type:complete len:209 (+),score=-13.91 TRINITY_DN2741_c0_g1_i8:427-1053(+)